MKSNYKPIGNYIQRVEERNNNLKVTRLLGLSMTKEFRETTSNIVGTDMSVYKVMRKYQFACDFMSPIRVNKLPVVLKLDDEPNLVSPAYPVFEVKDKNELDPEYLMMWFRRAEFDRFVTFKCDAAIRGGYDWDELCQTLIPVPHIDKQRELVKEYNIIQNRINLNQQLIQKLEDTAQTIYKQWFVEFEFPDQNGNPYKSSGGEMVNSELGEIPKGWVVTTIKAFCKEMKSGGTPSRDNINYWNVKEIPWLKTGEVCNRVLIASEEYITLEGCQNSSAKILPINTVLIAMYGEGKTKGQSGYLRFEAATNQACCAMICNNEMESTFLYYFFRINQSEIASLANGGAQPNLSKELIANIRVAKPMANVINKHHFIRFVNYSEALERENQKLSELKDLLLSKLAKVGD